MEEISFKGENYVKASVLADKYGYTSDYVGQLCRSDQVKATLVGRSWYVTEESLLGHRKGRYRSTLAKSKEMVRKLAEERVRSQLPMNVKKIVRYETDERELLPELGPFDDVELSPVNSHYEGTLETEFVKEEIEETRNQPESEISDIEAEVVSVPITRYERPTVRTVPAFTAPERPKAVLDRSRSVLERPRHSHKKSKSSWTPALVVSLCLVSELAIVMVALGLEKKIIVSEEGGESVVYTFEPELVASAARAIWSR